ncbi:hypothetical protein pEaSNUABM29_00200 [Erwinia phage pEa_SNUABM_29]|nr:hypothetical protein pEaSNUABM29_00200 [Erwinia phage pEa_SNUABM_29]
MSMTPIDYDVVVKELSKGLIALDSDIAKSCNMMPHIALSEFRTIRYGAGRQKGVTTHAVDMAAKFDGHVLYLIHNVSLRDDVVRRYTKKSTGISSLTSLCGYLPENWQGQKYGLVLVDEASFFFHKFSYDKIFRSLATMVESDVVIHLIN